MNKALILLSGGQDSTTCLYWAKKKFDSIQAIGFNYGQRHIIELDFAKKICDKENISFDIISLKEILSNSALMNPQEDLNKSHPSNQNLPNSFNNTLNHFKKYNNCVLIFIRDTNLKSVTQTLRDYKSKDFYKKGKDKLIKNYGIGAQIIRSLQIKNMILVTRSRKKVVGLDGYGIKITKQEIIK